MTTELYGKVIGTYAYSGEGPEGTHATSHWSMRISGGGVAFGTLNFQLNEGQDAPAIGTIFHIELTELAKKGE